ncbi:MULTISPECIES: hypothetical protein [Amycolatopsis]|uniref:Uncharacterized protein n=1 Tax=Amycolatopsis albidoflavus TaxID=102226 RepID=A0ABW5HRZ8_9PSEU
MPRHTIETPVDGYTGHVAGVDFLEGRGETSDENAVAYFQRHGYTVTPAEDDGETAEPPVADPDDTKRSPRRTPAK